MSIIFIETRIGSDEPNIIRIHDSGVIPFGNGVQHILNQINLERLRAIVDVGGERRGRYIDISYEAGEQYIPRWISNGTKKDLLEGHKRYMFEVYLPAFPERRQRQGIISKAMLKRKYHLRGECKRLPYLNFNTKYPYEDGMCVQGALRFLYCKNKNKITIDPYFKEQTFEELINCITGNNISADIRDILLNPLYVHDGDNKHHCKLQAILYDNHIYICIKDPKNKNLYERTPNHDFIYEFSDTGVAINTVSLAHKSITGDLFENFTLNCEMYNCKSRDFYYMREDVPSRDEAKKSHIYYDMIRCYYNSFMKSLDTEIGVFSICYDWHQYNGSICSYGYYLCKFARDNIIMKVRGNDFMLGFEIQWIRNNTNVVVNIIMEKLPYKTITGREWLSRIDSDAIHEEKGVFNMLIGMACKTVTLSKERMVLPKKDEDRILLGMDGTQSRITKVYGGGKILNINGRNIYNHVLALAHIYVWEVMNMVKDKSNIIRVVTDGILIHKDEKIHHPLFIVKDDYGYNSNLWYSPCDIDLLMKNIKEEIELRCNDRIIGGYIGGQGVGKTYNVLKDKGFDLCSVVSNICLCNNMKESSRDGLTICRLFGLFSKGFNIHTVHKKKIWIDEIGMMGREMWNHLFTSDNQYILSGDMKHQLPPIGESRCQGMLIDTVISKLKLLVVNHRSTIDIINIANSKDMTMVRKVDRVGLNTLHICYTNKKRVAVNNAIVKKLGVVNKWDIGTLLVCKQNKSSDGLVNGLRFMVNVKNQEYVRNNSDMFQYGYCLTVHSLQGQTVNGSVCIHESAKLITREEGDLWHTAIGRVKDISQLSRMGD